MRIHNLIDCVITLLLLPAIALAHPPDEIGNHDSIALQLVPPALLLPDLPAARPWSDKPVLNDPGRFHFAIMTDRTGGHRPGIWMRGVRKLNLMRPEFVVSVGDLIEGYTDDRSVVEKEWEQFLGFVDQLEMRFFFVAGNHDLTNPMMHDIWRDRFGPEWYSFDYQGVHFVCLSSEDPTSHIGDKQLTWVAEDLERHADARWTLVFLHKPLWVYADRELAAGNPDPTNWKKVERILGTRPHNVFTGHHHRYVQFDRNGMKYYQLATTGGGSQLRGQQYGEFDHVVWVTMEKDGPRVANLLLDGVLPADVVTEKGIRRFRRLLQDTLIEVAPILIESGDRIAEGRVSIRLTNKCDEPVRIEGHVEGLPLHGLTIESEPLQLQANPGASQPSEFRFRLDEPIHFRHFARTVLTAKVRTMGEDPLTAELTVPVVIGQRNPCPRFEVKLDGRLDEWPEGNEYATPEHPRIMGASHQWQGLTDASVHFRVAHNADHLYFGGRLTDDAMVSEVDAVYFFIDPRGFEERVAAASSPKGLNVIFFRIDFSQGVDEPKMRAGRQGVRPKPAADSRVAVVPQADGYDFEIAIPIKHLQDAQGGDWSSFQLNVAIRDADEPSDEHCFIPWRGTDQVGRSAAHYSHFFR